MKRMTYISLALLTTSPAFAADNFQGDINLGLRTTHFASGDKSAKFDEYRDMSNGVFGDANVLFDTDAYYIGLVLENPTLDDQFYEMKAGQFGLGKARFYFDELNHQLSRDALTPATGIGSNYLIVPTTVPPVSAWTPFDYSVKKKTYGAEFTVDPQQMPFYFKASVEQQKSDGIMPYGLTNYTGFELPMPIDYTTNNLMFESGYRNPETTAVVTAGYSKFENSNDILTTLEGTDVEEYSTAADNYSYNFGARLVQRLPMASVLALKASYTRNISEADWSQYTQFTAPSADGNFDGDVRYIHGSAVLSSQWSAMLDTRVYYNYVDRNNDSEQITTLDDGRTNDLFEYDKNEAGIDANYRLTKSNKLNGGYQFNYTNRNREDAENTTDNLVFAQLKNTSLEWMSTIFRLEYLHRSSDANYDAEVLADPADVRPYFSPFDYADKNSYKAKLAFEFTPAEGLDLGLSYTMTYDKYNATQLGLQDDQKHDIRVDVNTLLPAKIRLNTYAGYEYTKSNLDSRNYNGNNADPTVADTSGNYNWSQESSYDYFVIGGNLTVPVIHQLDLVFTADLQWNNGNIDFSRSAVAAAGVATEPITNADDYYKTQLGAKGIYQATDAWSITLGYYYEKSNLDEWMYDNYSYTPSSTPTSAPSFYLSGAGLDNDYEAHQVYVITTFHF